MARADRDRVMVPDSTVSLTQIGYFYPCPIPRGLPSVYCEFVKGDLCGMRIIITALSGVRFETSNAAVSDCELQSPGVFQS